MQNLVINIPPDIYLLYFNQIYSYKPLVNPLTSLDVTVINEITDDDLNNGYIYLIRNKHNNTPYIGQSKCFKKLGDKYVKKSMDERFKQHMYRAFNLKTQNECQKFYQAVRQYGREAFELIILDKCPLTILNSRERYWIRKYNSKKRGYNIHRGGKKKPQAYRKHR